jgi:hypothetical protein
MTAPRRAATASTVPGAVMVSTSHLFPAKVSHSYFLLQRLDRIGSCSIVARSDSRSLYEYG